VSVLNDSTASSNGTIDLMSVQPAPQHHHKRIARVSHSDLATPYEGVLEHSIRVFLGIICTEELNLDNLWNLTNGVRYAKSEENMG
jgi:hypothetical protein